MVRLPKYVDFHGKSRIPVDKTNVLPSPRNSWNTEYRLIFYQNPEIPFEKKTKYRIPKNHTTPTVSWSLQITLPALELVYNFVLTLLKRKSSLLSEFTRKFSRLTGCIRISVKDITNN